jgi:hypothetical protein
MAANVQGLMILEYNYSNPAYNVCILYNSAVYGLSRGGINKACIVIDNSGLTRPRLCRGPHNTQINAANLNGMR